MLTKLLSSIHFLAQQVPLHGHEDVNSFDGNLYKLLLQAEDCPQLKYWVHQKYTSPDIINEIITETLYFERY